MVKILLIPPATCFHRYETLGKWVVEGTKNAFGVNVVLLILFELTENSAKDSSRWTHKGERRVTYLKTSAQRGLLPIPREKKTLMYVIP